MNMKLLFAVVATGLALAAAPLRAEDARPEMKCSMKEHDTKKQEMEKKMEAMEAKLKAEAAEIDKLLDEMNASIGDKKFAAMAAVINKMAQKQKEMKAKCDAMMNDGMMQKDGKAELKAELEYYTCKMHPAVHWPVLGKCPLCSMDLVPVFKKSHEASPDGKPAPKAEAKPDEESKKADDSHADHH